MTAPFVAAFEHVRREVARAQSPREATPIHDALFVERTQTAHRTPNGRAGGTTASSPGSALAVVDLPAWVVLVGAAVSLAGVVLMFWMASK